MQKIDVPKLIKEVEKRPTLWDMATKEYSDRVLRKECWQEITALFAKENMTAEEREELEVVLQKKWKNIRDIFAKDIQGKKRNAGSGGKATYMYSRHLQFLKNTIQRRRRADPLEVLLKARQNSEDRASPSTATSAQKPSSTMKISVQKIPSSSMTAQKTPVSQNMDKSGMNTVKETISSSQDRLNRNESPSVENDDNRQFLLSMLPTLASLPKRLNSKCRLEFMQVLDKYEEYAFMQKQDQGNPSQLAAVYIESHYEPEQSQLPSPAESMAISYASSLSEESKCTI